jgi:alpha-methylacyl-CoA racemase
MRAVSSVDPDAAPLCGTRVLSVGHTLPGLYCCAMLRDLGAEVVLVERVRQGKGEPGPYADLLGRFPMRSVRAGTSECRLDLRDPRGRDAFLRMAERADAVLEGFRPGVAARLGIGFAVLCARRPALVYAAISGYGQEGPLAQRVGHDLNYLAETGVLGLANPVGLPGTTFADGLAGVSAALNVVAALAQAARSGRGQFLDLAIVDSPLFLLASELEHYWGTGESRGPGDTHLTGRYPWYAIHRDASGDALAVGAVEPHFHRALVERLGHPELAAQQFAEGDAREGAHAALRDAFAARTRAQIEAELSGADACVSPVRTIAEVAASPLAERALRRDAGSEKLLRTPVRLPLAELEPERDTPRVLADFGFGAAEVRELIAAGVAGEAA